MIENIYIQHFRGIYECKIENLKQFNLFLGKNNCGKTSILDALFLFSNGNNPTLGLQINNIRNYITNFSECIRTIFYGIDTTHPIVIKGKYQSKIRHQEITFEEKNAQKVDLTSVTTNEELKKNYILRILNRHQDEKPSESSLSVFDNDIQNADMKTKANYQEIPAYYMPSSIQHREMLKAFSMILKNKEEKYIIQKLQQIEPTIKDIVIVENQIMTDIGLSQRIPIEVMGDGIKKIFSIILNIYQSQNGILLLDEVDNGLHYSSMPVMWQTILHTAKECNTQNFATTHNLDSLHSLNQVLKREEYHQNQESVSIYTLRKDFYNGTLHAFQSNYSQFSHLTEQNIEMR